MSNCPICLSNCKDAVSIPCGHTFCGDCLTDYLGTYCLDGMTAACPTCRTNFNTVIPSLVALPRQFHRFLYQPIRRIYLDNNPDTDLQERLDAALLRIRHLEDGERVLIRECERHLANSRAHQEAERTSRKNNKTLKRELAQSRDTEETLTQELADLRERMADTENDADARERELRYELRELHDQAEESRHHLEDQLQTLEDERDGLIHLEQSLRSDIEDLRRERDILERNTSDLQKNYDYIKQKYESLKKLQRDSGSANNNHPSSSSKKRKAIKRSSSSEEEEDAERPHIKRRVVNVAAPDRSDEQAEKRRKELIAWAGISGAEFVAGSSDSASRPRVKRETADVPLPRPALSTVPFRTFSRSSSHASYNSAGSSQSALRFLSMNKHSTLEDYARRLPPMKLRRDDSEEEDDRLSLGSSDSLSD